VQPEASTLQRLQLASADLLQWPAFALWWSEEGARRQKMMAVSWWTWRALDVSGRCLVAAATLRTGAVAAFPPL